MEEEQKGPSKAIFLYLELVLFVVCVMHEEVDTSAKGS